MKFIRRLSSITLVSCLCVSSGAAMAKVTEQVSNPTSSAPTEPVIIANPLRRIQDAVRTIREVDQTVDSVTSLIEQQNRRRELEAARKAATERERLEAERRQRYFESLSPEEQQAYIEEQRAQSQSDRAAAILVPWAALFMLGGLSSEPAQAESSYDRYEDAPECREVGGWLHCQ